MLLYSATPLTGGSSLYRPSNLRRGFHRNMSTVTCALGYRAIWGKTQFYLMVGSLPGVTPKPLFGPNLDSTDGAVRLRRRDTPAMASRNLPRFRSRRLDNPTVCGQLRRMLAFTRYCQRQYCIVYGIQRRGRWGGACIAQWSCNSIAIGYTFQVGGSTKGRWTPTIRLYREALSCKA